MTEKKMQGGDGMTHTWNRTDSKIISSGAHASSLARTPSDSPADEASGEDHAIVNADWPDEV